MGYGPIVVNSAAKRACVGVMTVGVLFVAAGCASAKKAPDRTLRPIVECSASVKIPDDVSRIVPSAATPPTSILRIGDAVAFDAAVGSAVSSVGPVDDPQGPSICQSVRGTGTNRQALIVGLEPGFTTVGVVSPGSPDLRRFLVTVTG